MVTFYLKQRDMIANGLAFLFLWNNLNCCGMNLGRDFMGRKKTMWVPRLRRLRTTDLKDMVSWHPEVIDREDLARQKARKSSKKHFQVCSVIQGTHFDQRLENVESHSMIYN